MEVHPAGEVNLGRLAALLAPYRPLRVWLPMPPHRPSGCTACRLSHSAQCRSRLAIRPKLASALASFQQAPKGSSQHAARSSPSVAIAPA